MPLHLDVHRDRGDLVVGPIDQAPRFGDGFRFRPAQGLIPEPHLFTGRETELEGGPPSRLAATAISRAATVAVRLGHRRVAAAPPPDRSAARPPGPDRPVRQEPPQVLGQLAGRLVAARRLAGDRLEDDRLQVARDVAVRAAAAAAARRVTCSISRSGRSRRRPAAASASRRGSAPRRRCRPAGRTRPRTAPGHVAQRAEDVAGAGQVASSAALARPKSVTQTVPWASSSRFDGLMSRWRRPGRGRSRRASATCTPIRATPRK